MTRNPRFIRLCLLNIKQQTNLTTEVHIPLPFSGSNSHSYKSRPAAHRKEREKSPDVQSSPTIHSLLSIGLTNRYQQVTPLTPTLKSITLFTIKIGIRSQHHHSSARMPRSHQQQKILAN
jgi:hypothetical protein